MTFHVPEQFRIIDGPMASNDSYGNNGAFNVKMRTRKKPARLYSCIASDQMGWEHVSVSLPHRTPNWDEMCQIKELFWDDGDLVVQFHVPKSDWINNHPYCLHLWRKSGTNIFCDRPPGIFVGIKNDR